LALLQAQRINPVLRFAPMNITTILARLDGFALLAMSICLKGSPHVRL
jgi:hypothetical protein